MPLDNHQTTQPQPHPQEHATTPDETTTQPPYRTESFYFGKIEFASGSTELGDPQRSAIKQFARNVAFAALENDNLGLPPLNVELVGHSNGIREDGSGHYRTALQRGAERAQSAAVYLSGVLSTYSQFLQDKKRISQPLNIDITIRTEGAEQPFGSKLDEDPLVTRQRVNVWVIQPRLLDLTAGDHSHASSATGEATRRDRAQEEIDRDVELQQMKDQIAHEFGVTLDSEAGVRAVLEHRSLGVTPEIVRKIKPVPWSARAVREIAAAFKYYKPILGDSRQNSNRNGIPQEVNIVGNLTWTFWDGEPILSTAGEYIKTHKIFNIYTYAHIDPSVIRETAVHEISHGLLKYSWPEFHNEFWTGHERPPLSAKTPWEDLVISLMQHIEDRAMLEQRSPRHAAAIASLEMQRPDAFTRRQEEEVLAAAIRIAGEIDGSLELFTAAVGTWNSDGKPQTFFLKERPITEYGETNSDEDLAETAMVYFTDVDRLRTRAPLRAEFMDRLVKGWQQRRDTETSARSGPSRHDTQSWASPSAEGQEPNKAAQDDRKISSRHRVSERKRMSADVPRTADSEHAETSTQPRPSTTPRFDDPGSDQKLPPQQDRLNPQVPDNRLNHQRVGSGDILNDNEDSQKISTLETQVGAGEFRGFDAGVPDDTVRQFVGGGVSLPGFSGVGGGVRVLGGVPRYVVRSGFDVRGFRINGTSVTDLTVRVAFRGKDGHDVQAAWQRLVQGTNEYYNRPGYALPGGDLLHVTVERVTEDADPHLVVDLAGRDRPMDQHTWWPDADPVAYAHELGHQLGLRDEYRDSNEQKTGRAHIAGSLLGDFSQVAPEGLAQSGLRGRHLQLLSSLIGDIAHPASTTAPHHHFSTGGPDRTALDRHPDWNQTRLAVPATPRQHIWVDPITSPTHATDASAVYSPRMPDSGQTVHSQPHGLPHETGIVLQDTSQHPAYRIKRELAVHLDFKPESIQLGEEEQTAIHQIGVKVFNASQENAKIGLPPLSIEIVGHSNGLREDGAHHEFAKQRGLQRAHAVAESLRRVLASHADSVNEQGRGNFRFWRIGMRVPKTINPGLIQITTRSAGNDLPSGKSQDGDPYEARRCAVIWYSQPLHRESPEYNLVAEDSNAARYSQEEINTDAAIQQLKDEVQDEFGITLDSRKGSRAVLESYGVIDSDVASQIRPMPWTVPRIRGLITALKHYKPILGKDRENSSRSGFEQEVNIIGNVSWTIVPGTRDQIDVSTDGEAFPDYKTFNLYTYAHFNPHYFTETIVHELSHNLLVYALPQFDAEFWKGYQEPRTQFLTPEADFADAIAQRIADPGALEQSAPRYAAVMDRLDAREPGKFTIRSGETIENAVRRITDELRGHLGWFTHEVGTWTEDGQPRAFFSRERPITKYGEMNSDEDLAETAAVYFTDIERLEADAPLRADFMARLVEGWKQRRDAGASASTD
ncbi:hypothetical protein [Streptomyces sp. NPDC094468]|uniref:hypothetical protein n=1 Tax=Streptomyces sp. NPDC094468 TaxID=3366066 RepID=UPI003830D06C